MFTTEPTLSQRIERMIGQTPLIDPHSHLRGDRPGAPDLAALMGHAELVTELRSAGMPADDFDPSLPPDERVRRSIPYLKRARNTTMAWCLFRIFRDLYDFHDPHLTAENSRELFDKVLAAGRDGAWASSILCERLKLKAVVTGLENRSDGPAGNPSYMSYRLDVDSFLAPAAGTGVASPEALLANRPDSAGALRAKVCDWLDRALTDDVAFLSASLPADALVAEPDPKVVEAVLGVSPSISSADIEALVPFLARTTLQWLGERGKPLQLNLTAPRGGRPAAETWKRELARALGRFPGVRFDLMTTCPDLRAEVAFLARQLPNVYAAGTLGPDFSPAAIERNLGLQVQLTPMAKFSGFLSDAPCAEWIYGKFQVVRKALASTLSHLVEAGYYEEEDLPPLLKQILHDTPRDLYGLSH